MTKVRCKLSSNFTNLNCYHFALIFVALGRPFISLAYDFEKLSTIGCHDLPEHCL